MRPFAQLEHDLSLAGHFKKKTEEELYAAAYRFDGTAQLLLELIVSGKPMSSDDFNHAVVPTTGPTGTGKSTIVQKELSFLRRVIYKENIALLRERKRDQQVHCTWSPLQTISRMRAGKVHDLDSLYQDEHRRGRVGQGSATNDWLLQQSEETLRANGNSFFPCSPSPREHTPHWIQETIGFNKNTGVNSAYILGPRYRKPICSIHLGSAFKIDPHISSTYIASKKAYTRKTREGGGWSQELDPEIEQYTYDEVMEHVEVGMTRAEIEHIYNELGLFPGFYMGRIVSRVTSTLKRLERELKDESRKERLLELQRIEEEQKEMFMDVADSIIRYYESLGLDKRPMMGAIKHEARVRGILKDTMGQFTDYFLSRWTEIEAKRPKAEGKAVMSDAELVEQGHRAENKGKAEEIRWQHKFSIDSELIRQYKPNNGRRAPPGKPDLQIWTSDGGLWCMAIKYRQDYHNAWIPYFLKSGEEKPCPEFRIARTIVGGAETLGCELEIIKRQNFYGVKIHRNGVKEKWVPSYVVVPFCGQIAGNEFFETINFLTPTTRGYQCENIDEFNALDTPATSYIEAVNREIFPPKGKSSKSSVKSVGKTIPKGKTTSKGRKG